MSARSRAAQCAVALFVATGLLLPTPSATADGASAERAGSGCRVPADDGNKRQLYSSLTKKYEVKQINQDENYSGAPKELEFVLQRSKTVSNSVTKTAETSAGLSIKAFGSLEAKAGVNLGDVNTKFEFEQVTERLKLKSGDVYFRARGVRAYKLTTTFQTCFRRGPQMVWVTSGKATATGHLVVKAVVGCKQKVPVGSFSKQVKGYCP